MAVVTVKSAALTLMDTAGGALPVSRQARSDLEVGCGKAELASGDSIASIYRCVRVPSNCRISQVLLKCSAITTCAGDIGVYRADTGAVVDVDLFASAQSLASALAILTDVTNESTTITPVIAEQPLWQAGGLTADPGGYFDIAVTLTAAAGSAGQVFLEARYAV
jgi:hypothetical protein